MKIALISYSKKGRALSERLEAGLSDCETLKYVPKRLSDGGFLPIDDTSSALYKRLFFDMDALIFIGSCGIAVRCIAPYVSDKRTDPAVIVADELGRFVIPILSGHIGGANALSERIAEIIRAVPVITTATDINGRFSPDEWAMKNGFIIDDISLSKTVSAAVLEGDVPVACDFPVKGAYPAGICEGRSGGTGILISYKTGEKPFSKTLRLIPRVLHVGVGCKKGTSAEAIEAAVESVFKAHAIDMRAIKQFSTIDIKGNEAGLLEYCRKAGKPLVTYTAGELSSLSGEFSSSDFVKSVTGVDNVCERAAMMGAKALIVKKTACGGVTVAVAEEIREVRFE
ncbi:MAG: cobalamin biosynthesis protein [Clostridia bacterium]|nr:cobalamin biosynthesis protein [Clostridia bacterium]